jgi:hypothetical protein
MAIKITLRHKVTSPIAIADCGSLLPNTSISAPGTELANRDVSPKHKPKSPGQPQRTVATIVAIRLVFLLFIVFISSRRFFSEYTPAT